MTPTLHSDGGKRQLDPHTVWSLVDQVQAGESTAFAELYKCYVDTIFGYAVVRTRDSALAEEITSETFLRALTRIHSVTHRRSTFRAWLMTIARNLIADHVRSVRRCPTTVLPDEFELIADSPDPAGLVCEKEAHRHLLRCMEKLPDDQWECLMSRFFDGLSVAETARKMSRSNCAVRALQLRGVRSLAGLFSGSWRATAGEVAA